MLDDDYDPRLIEAFRAQPPEVVPVAVLRAAFATAFGGMTAGQRADQRERVVLALTSRGCAPRCWTRSRRRWA